MTPHHGFVWTFDRLWMCPYLRMTRSHLCYSALIVPCPKVHYDLREVHFPFHIPFVRHGIWSSSSNKPTLFHRFVGCIQFETNPFQRHPPYSSNKSVSTHCIEVRGNLLPIRFHPPISRVLVDLLNVSQMAHVSTLATATEQRFLGTWRQCEQKKRRPKLGRQTLG